MADEYELIETANCNTLRGFLQLMRLPNVFTAMADVAMGFLYVWGDDDLSKLSALSLLVISSSLLYLGGMMLNDIVDRKLDAIERPRRPLPSGRVTLKAASIACGIFLFFGAACGWLVSASIGKILPGVVATSLLACILLYDYLLKTKPLGPLAMGGCRMLNVLLGMSVTAVPLAADNWLVAGGIGLYIVGVTWFARTEAQRSNHLPLVLAAAVMMAAIATIAWVPRWIENVWFRQSSYWWYLLILAISVMIGWRCLAAIINPESRWVQRAVGHAVLSLIVLDASACFIIRGPYLAAAILMLMLPALFLSRRISPT
jgi:4-hydroxybenzoate polyprenyltransferase